MPAILRTLFLTALLLTMGAANSKAAYELPYVGDQIEYETAYEDTFVHIARDYNLGFTEMRAANPYVDPWLPGRNTDIILPTRHLLPETERKGIVINLAEMRLYAYVNGDEAPYTTPIGVGREGLDTPVGKTKITRKKAGPTWRPTPRMLKEDPELEAFYPPGPDNPLGTHALYLGWPTYAIHGTNRPFGIGRRISSGCIRLYPESITKLFEMIPVGTPVQVVNQPIKLAWIDNKLYLEAHPTLEQSIAFEEMGEAPEQKLNNQEMKYLIKTAGPHQERLRWSAIRTAIKERTGYPVLIARRSAVKVEDNEIIKDASVNDESFETPEEAKELLEGSEEKTDKKTPLDEIYSEDTEEQETTKQANFSGLND